MTLLVLIEFSHKRKVFFETSFIEIRTEHRACKYPYINILAYALKY